MTSCLNLLATYLHAHACEATYLHADACETIMFAVHVMKEVQWGNLCHAYLDTVLSDNFTLKALPKKKNCKGHTL